MPVKAGIGFVGAKQISSIDQLVTAYQEMTNAVNIPTHQLVDVIEKELSSQKLIDFLRDMPIPASESVSLKELAGLFKNIPKKLYFFLWSLQNSDVIPIQGVLTSCELHKAVYALIRFLRVLERFSYKCQTSIPLFENLGHVYFDLAGLAQYAARGLLIERRFFNQTTLLRKAITCFQRAIQLESEQGNCLDASHKHVLGLVDDEVFIKEKRLLCYLNPWYFLYISSALGLLNDQKVAGIYLAKARSILNMLDGHQNPRLRKQKAFLESIYATLHYGKFVRFDFGERNLRKIRKKLQKVQKAKSDGRGCYSPFVESALSNQLETQHKLVAEGKLQAEQSAYLNGIHTLYTQSISAHERDKLIYRLNIPPVKLSGLPGSVKKGQTMRAVSDVRTVQPWSG